jgi:hypothetical protein
MSHKRSADAAGMGSGSSTAAADVTGNAGSSKAATIVGTNLPVAAIPVSKERNVPLNKRSKVLDSLLDDLDDEDEDEDEDEDQAG